MVATLFQLVGFGLMVVGVALWSVPAGCIVAGLLLFVAGGVEARR